MNFLMLSYSKLKLKSINDLIIPEQLQSIIHITACLVQNQCDDIFIKEICDFINNSEYNFTSISYILNSLSKAFPKYCSSYWKIYETIKSNFNSYDFKPKKLYLKEYDEIFPVQDIRYLVAWDNLDDFINKLEKESIDINQKVDGMSLIDIACKYGSEKCFSYLNLKSAKISDRTCLFAVEGGNKNIVITLFNEKCFEISDDYLTVALKYHHNDIFDWLLETKGSIGELINGECFSFGNMSGILFLIENGFNINCEYVESTHPKYIFIIIIRNLSFLFVNLVIK